MISTYTYVIRLITKYFQTVPLNIFLIFPFDSCFVPYFLESIVVEFPLTLYLAHQSDMLGVVSQQTFSSLHNKNTETHFFRAIRFHYFHKVNSITDFFSLQFYICLNSDIYAFNDALISIQYYKIEYNMKVPETNY